MSTHRIRISSIWCVDIFDHYMIIQKNVAEILVIERTECFSKIIVRGFQKECVNKIIARF